MEIIDYIVDDCQYFERLKKKVFVCMELVRKDVRHYIY